MESDSGSQNPSGGVSSASHSEASRISACVTSRTETTARPRSSFLGRRIQKKAHVISLIQPTKRSRNVKHCPFQNNPPLWSDVTPSSVVKKGLVKNGAHART